MRKLALAVVLLASTISALTVLARPAAAQTSIDAGKTPQQIFQSDCSPCHKTAQGLYKGASPMLRSFLTQHYMSSRETAQTMADYLAAQDKGPAAKPAAAPTQRRQGRHRPEPGEAKPNDVQPGDAQPAATPAERRPAAPKPTEAKPPEPAPAAAPPAAPAPAPADAG